MSMHEGSVRQRMLSQKGRTAISHFFVMDWASLWVDIVVGLLIAGALSAWVPQHFWQGFFLEGQPVLAKFWGPLIGPLVAVISFVCSVGNVPLAAVLWSGGISFGGVISFLFADLIVLPILDIYRKYYGMKMAAFLAVTFYLSMSLSALAIEFIFGLLHLIPHERSFRLAQETIRWNYTTWINIVFLLIAASLVWRFLRTGGPGMLRVMSKYKFTTVNEWRKRAQNEWRKRAQKQTSERVIFITLVHASGPVHLRQCVSDCSDRITHFSYSEGEIMLPAPMRF